MLLDANILLYAVDSTSPSHESARAWLEDVLNGDNRVALPWQTIGAVLRICTHPRVFEQPLTSTQAWGIVQAWLDRPLVWIPPTGPHTAAILGRLLNTSGATGNLVPDAALAALAIEHGLTVISADTDFARFPQVRHLNPLA